MLTEAIRRTYAAGLKRENDEARGGGEWFDEDAELPTERAEAEAAIAYAAAEQGDLHQARYHAHLACQHEAEEFGDSPAWSPFLHAIERALAGARPKP